MFRRSPILGFLCRFALIFGLLIIPWPGWDDIYGHYFRAWGTAAFSSDTGKRLVKFEQHDMQHGFTYLGTQMTLGNRDLVDSEGNGPVRNIELDTRSIGWVPTALTMALILATPVSWRRRGLALLWGLLLIHAFLIFTLLSFIWNQSPELSLTELAPWQKQIIDALEYTLITQLGASFSVPVLIWIVVTLRQEDISLFTKERRPAPTSASSTPRKSVR